MTGTSELVLGPSLTLEGDLTLDGDSAAVVRLGGSAAGRKVVFNGTTDQHISILEPDLDVQAYRMEVDKSGGRLKINNDITATHEFTLTDGVVECLSDAVITLNDGVEPTDKDTSYVEGKVKKIGDDVFEFPIGSNGHYRPIAISAPSSSTDAFTAEHINEDSDPTYDHDSKEGTINEISTNEYWTLSRDVGTSDVTVTLSWDDMSCGFDTLANLRTVAWDATAEEWKDLGNGGTTGDTDEGTIASNGASTIYVAYTMGTIDEFDCVPCRADAGEDVNVYETYWVQIGTNEVAGNTYSWIPSETVDDETLAKPMARPDDSSEYTVEVTNSEGCVASDNVYVTVDRLVPLFRCLGGGQ